MVSASRSGAWSARPCLRWLSATALTSNVSFHHVPSGLAILHSLSLSLTLSVCPSLAHALLFPAATSHGNDWEMWGEGPSSNSCEVNIPRQFLPVLPERRPAEESVLSNDAVT
jgi:hypothetical protein